jgi:hypothetical protein
MVSGEYEKLGKGKLKKERNKFGKKILKRILKFSDN